jgi:hypothetical protein
MNVHSNAARNPAQASFSNGARSLSGVVCLARDSMNALTQPANAAGGLTALPSVGTNMNN